jgi:hypothetical protein
MSIPTMSNDDLSFQLDKSSSISVPPHILEVYNNVRTELEECTIEVDSIITSIIEDVNIELDEIEQEIVTILAGTMGAMDVELDSIEEEIHRKIMGVMNTAYKEQMSIEADLMDNGVGVPVMTSDMKADLETGTYDWIAARLGGNSQPITPTIAPEIAPDESHLCTSCATEQPATGEIAAVEPFISNGSALPVTKPPIQTISAPSLGTDPLPPEPVIYACGKTPPLPPGWLVEYTGTPTNCIERLIAPYGGGVGIGELDPYWQKPGWVFAGSGQQWAGFRPAPCTGGCGGVSPPGPPPPLSPPPDVCPPSCPIPVDVHVDVKYPDPPLPPPPPGPVPPSSLPSTTPIIGAAVNWTSLNVCDIASVKVNTPGIATPPSGGSRGRLEDRSWSMQIRDLWKDAGSFIDFIGSGFKQEEIDKARARLAEEYGITINSSSALTSLFNGLAPDAVPNLQAAINFGTKLAIANRTQVITGAPLDYLMQNEEYLFHYANPQYIPTQPELNLCYNHSVITKDQWTCLTMAHGNIPEGQAWILDAQQLRPIPSEVIGLYNRGKLTEADFYKLMREAGVLQTVNSDRFYELAKFVPGPSDLVRFMVRDAADPTVVEQYNLDFQFKDKFYGDPTKPGYGQMSAWAKAQGMTEEQFIYFWRSHWDIPSNTALYEAQSRLRPDRPEYQQYSVNHAIWVNNGRIGAEPEQPPVAMPTDIARALTVNDMSPTFVPWLMALAYVPMTKTDAVRAYEIGYFNDDQLYHVMRDNRHDEVTARTMVGFYNQQRNRRLSNSSGVWTIRKILKAFKEGTLTSDEAFAQLHPLMSDVRQRQQALDGADREVKAERMGRWIKVYRRAYFVGEASDVRTRTDLTNLGLDPKRIDDLLDEWYSDKVGRYREATAGKLIKWAVLNIISADELYKRLRTLGYSDIDANRMIYEAMDRQNKQTVNEINKIVKDLEKRFKDKAQARKATRDELEKRLKELDKERERIMKEQERRRP